MIERAGDEERRSHGDGIEAGLWGWGKHDE